MYIDRHICQSVRLSAVACVLKERPAVVSSIDCCSFNATMCVLGTDTGMQAGAAHDLLRSFTEYLARHSLEKTLLHCSGYISKRLRFVLYTMIGQLVFLRLQRFSQPTSSSCFRGTVQPYIWGWAMWLPSQCCDNRGIIHQQVCRTFRSHLCQGHVTHNRSLIFILLKMHRHIAGKPCYQISP